MQLLILRDKPFEEVAEQLISWKPNLVYFTSGAAQLGSSLAPGDQPWPQKQPEGLCKPLLSSCIGYDHTPVKAVSALPFKDHIMSLSIFWKPVSSNLMHWSFRPEKACLHAFKILSKVARHCAQVS